MSFLIDDFFPSHLRTPRREHPNDNNNMISGTSHTNIAEALDPASVMELDEDETSIRLTMDMPGVRGQDIQVSVQRGVLSIRGYRCIKSMDGRILKKQKLSRRFAVDTDVVDVSRAVANIWNGVLVLYAPKKSKPVTVSIPVTEKPDFVFYSPATSPGATTIFDDDDSHAEVVLHKPAAVLRPTNQHS